MQPEGGLHGTQPKGGQCKMQTEGGVKCESSQRGVCMGCNLQGLSAKCSLRGVCMTCSLQGLGAKCSLRLTTSATSGSSGPILGAHLYTEVAPVHVVSQEEVAGVVG